MLLKQNFSCDTWLQRLPLLMLICTLCGCTAQVYPGPTRPDSEVSSIHIRSSGAASIESILINEQEVSGFSEIFKVLPGRQQIVISYRLEEAAPCHPSDWICETEVEYGSCSGGIETKAGRPYLITISNRDSLVQATALAKSYMDFDIRTDEPGIGTVACKQHYMEYDIYTPSRKRFE